METKARSERVTEFLVNLEKPLGPDGRPIPEPGTAEELFWLMEKSVLWLCDELDKIEAGAKRDSGVIINGV